MSKISNEEKDILESYELGEWRSVRDKGEGAARYQAYAKETFRKDRRINIRLSGRDLEAIQKQAIMEGIPYQTLIASVLHKFASGRLTEKD